MLRDGRSAGRGRARAANYTAAVGVDGGRVLLRDSRPARSAVLGIRRRQRLGPWTDQTNLALGDPTRYMGGTKGSHIVLDNAELLAATGGRELFFENEDGRIVLIYPLKGRVLVGTTDLELGMADPIVCTEAEVDYFIDLIGQVFRAIPVDRSEIVYRFSGVRPLPGHGDVSPGFVSRDYRIESAPTLVGGDATVLSLVGGKWTTFRASAEHLTDRTLALLARRGAIRPRRPDRRADAATRRPKRPASSGSPRTQAACPDRVATLLDRYGPSPPTSSKRSSPTRTAAAHCPTTAPASCGILAGARTSCTSTIC